ncbi:hypothetical protein E1B28_005066 [Marasmius oreades]|uniref:Oxysterol-binding protein n=1 Tax=Marasmius oreades TaxID=181124 RepID=A0A9P7V037_9AGAR|nr:uncharacterized protein E1B28_005066 [Marasmius oreades]KAG7097745.1 hypothetical protein E1B28_005066 [Marasmius oreades]
MAPHKDKDKQDTSSITDVIDEGAPGPPISVPDSGDTGEGGKLKMIVQLVKKCLGVKDIASMRLSLPASLLEPMPNLEFSQYLDRPDVFAAINDYDDPFDRMLAVIRWALTKDLKYIRGKVCKPYNSVLGEHFRSHWDVPPISHPASEPDEPPVPQIQVTEPISGTEKPEFTMLGVSDSASIRSGHSSTSFVGSFKSSILGNDKSPSTAATTPQQDGVDDAANRVSVLNLGEKVRVVYLTEQISHHPPISVYYGSCPDRHVELLGVDHISARISGTVLKVAPGAKAKGMFVRITGGKGNGELYRITHPTASINGLLRGSFYVTVSESIIITCTTGHGGKQFRTVLEYKEESWLGRPHFLIEGVIHTISEGDTQHEEWTKVKHVPPSRVVAMLDGSWRGLIRWRRVGTGSYPSHTISGGAHTATNSPNPSHTALPSPSDHKGASSRTDLTTVDSEWCTLIDLNSLWVVPKQVRPLEKQGEKESRKLWEGVTSRLLGKEFSDATREKVMIEQRQRDEAAERKRKGVEFVPRFFEADIESGIPVLTEEGKKAVEEEMTEDN